VASAAYGLSVTGLQQPADLGLGERRGDALLQPGHGHPGHGRLSQIACFDQPVEPGLDAPGVGVLRGVLEAAALQADEVGAEVGVIWATSGMPCGINRREVARGLLVAQQGLGRATRHFPSNRRTPPAVAGGGPRHSYRMRGQ